MYHEYSITLKSNGKFSVYSKGRGTSQSYSAEGTFEIKEETIFLHTKVGTATVTEEYDYVYGEIRMTDIFASGYTITAYFKRNQE